ncbi:hypothetical protein C8R44DRAFT_745144 [Mycena epipterygia]|nr:hypothetical protein C8R44DRAFT_745144 [Mycena epipterygia]
MAQGSVRHPELAALARITVLLKQQEDQSSKDNIQTRACHFGPHRRASGGTAGGSVGEAQHPNLLRIVGCGRLHRFPIAFILVVNSALNNDALLALNFIWFITTGGSLFIAGCTGIVAVAAGIGPPRHHSRRNAKYRRCGGIVIIIGLFGMLFTMLSGIILLLNSLAVDTPLGNLHLPATIIYPLLGAAVLTMVLLSVYLLWAGS